MYLPKPQSVDNFGDKNTLVERSILENIRISFSVPLENLRFPLMEHILLYWIIVNFIYWHITNSRLIKDELQLNSIVFPLRPDRLMYGLLNLPSYSLK